jgi:3-oxoacyl-[acyl-carrier-protein] synthase III
VLHDRLGLPADGIAMQLDASGYSFMMQLAIAEQLILSGRTRHALLVQSSATSRVLDPADPYGPLLGDGAAAVVVGPVERGGILAAVHRTDGRFPRGLVASVPERRWYDDGQIALHRADPDAARLLFLETADSAKTVVDAALAACGQRPADVDFFAVHQGTAWLRQVTQDTIGLERARSIDTFATTGYMFGVSIPLVLELGVQQGLLHDDDLVVMHGGGVGSTYGAIALRWQGGAS